jgi:WD40 repeat protein
MRHVGWLIGCRFSTDGRKLATFGYDQTARLWDPSTGEPLTAALAHRGAVRFATFSPDGLLLATLADDQACRVWDTRSGGLVMPPLRNGARAWMVAFAPDSRRLVTACSDGRADIYVLEEDDRPAGVLRAVAERLSGRKLDRSGGWVPLEAEALRDSIAPHQAGPR